MADLTLLYYTDNKISEPCANNVRKHLLRITRGKYPIISVSQKPIDFGTNICIGEIGKSYYNCYKQILEGAIAIKTKFVACCEDDTLYNAEYFTHRPSSDDVFAYNLNWWYAEDRYFWHKTTPNDTGMCQCICTASALIKNLKVRFEKFPVSPPVTDKQEQKGWCEPGRNDVKFGIPNAKIEYFQSKEPCLVFNHRGSLGGKMGSRRPMVFVGNLPAWGRATDIWEKFWEVKLTYLKYLYG